MDLKYRLTVNSALVFLACCPLFGAAKLRLDATAIGPVSVAAGANGPAQRVNALNAGDSVLNLSATSSVTWLTPTLRTESSCTLLGQCTQINIALNTASLARGTYTGIITVSDPNAIDAPQTISVTVAVGGGVPDNLTFYVPANGATVTQNFTSSGRVSTVNQPAGGPTLSLSLPAGGSFMTTLSYTVKAQAPTGTAQGAYNGSFIVAGSSVASENKTVPVTINVTSQPIGSVSPLTRDFRVAQNATKQTKYVLVSNVGSGDLTINTATPTVTTPTGGTWLTATPGPGYVGITADPTGLQPGSYQGTVAIATNAANASVTVPVTFTVVASGAPFVKAGAVVNNATFSGDTLAQGDFPALFGEQLTAGADQLSTNAPYPTTLGGATVFINDVAVPLYYVSQEQINFLIPYEAKLGDGTLRVDRDGQRGNTVSIRIVQRSPKLLLAANQAGQKVSDALGGALAPVKAGDFITLYGFGFGPTVPSVATNSVSPTSPLANVPGTNSVFFGQGGLFQNPVSTTPQYIGLSPTFISAFYQINVQIPATSPKGTAVPVYIQGDAGTTNSLLLNIQ